MNQENLVDTFGSARERTKTTTRQTLTRWDTKADEEAPMTIGEIGDQRLESDVGRRESWRQQHHEVRRNPNPNPKKYC